MELLNGIVVASPASGIPHSGKMRRNRSQMLNLQPDS